MKTKIVTVTGVLFANFNSNNEIYYGFMPENMAWYIPDSAVRIENNFSLEIEVPILSEEELRNKVILTLHEQKRKIDAEAEERKRHIDDKIQQLLVLTHQPTDPSAIEGEVL